MRRRSPRFFPLSLCSDLERASGGVGCPAVFGAAVTRSRVNPPPCSTPLPLLFPTGLNSRQQSPFSPFKKVHNRAKVGCLPTSGGFYQR